MILILKFPIWKYHLVNFSSFLPWFISKLNPLLQLVWWTIIWVHIESHDKCIKYVNDIHSTWPNIPSPFCDCPIFKSLQIMRSWRYLNIYWIHTMNKSEKTKINENQKVTKSDNFWVFLIIKEELSTKWNFNIIQIKLNKMLSLYIIIMFQISCNTILIGIWVHCFYTRYYSHRLLDTNPV